MKLLLDTQVLLWALSNDRQLSFRARELMLNERNNLFYSLASVWEVELKHSLHPHEMTLDGLGLSKFCQKSHITQVPLQERHIFAMRNIFGEGMPSHKDPFDLILLCQAMTENMLLLTHDASLMSYGESCICKI